VRCESRRAHSRARRPKACRRANATTRAGCPSRSPSSSPRAATSTTRVRALPRTRLGRTGTRTADPSFDSISPYVPKSVHAPREHPPASSSDRAKSCAQRIGDGARLFWFLSPSCGLPVHRRTALGTRSNLGCSLSLRRSARALRARADWPRRV
jgi:hypothetical protein